MTEAELFQAIKAEALKTTIGPYEFLRKVDDTENYDWTKTHWFTLMKYADKLKTLPVPTPPPPPLPSLAGMAQNVMFTVWNPHAGLRASVPKWKLAITADVHVTSDPEKDTPEVREQKAVAFTAAAIQAAQQWHDRGGLVVCWGNQEQIGAQQIVSFGKTIGADYLIFQAESEAEAASALAAVYDGITKVVIGNPNAFPAHRDAMAALIQAGRMALIFEVYTNEGAPWPDTATSQGVPAASEALGVGWGANPSYQLSSYKPHTAPAVWAGISPYLAEGFNEESWGLLP